MQLPNIHIIRELHAAGKLHRRLFSQVRMLSIISLVLLGIVVYEVLRYGISIYISLGISVVAFLFGLFVFSKMNKPVWDEEKEIIATARMDKTAFFILFLYIAFEISLRSFLQFEYAGTAAATGYLLAGIGASLLGRAMGTLVAIHRLIEREGLFSSTR